MEAREALTAYQLSVERNPTIRSFMEIAGDFGPPGEGGARAVASAGWLLVSSHRAWSPMEK